jgi:predicted RNase H-like nuclease
VGVDAPWWPESAPALPAATVTGGAVPSITTTLAYGLDEVIEFVGSFGAGAVTVAIDAPTVVPHLDNMRECEKRLHRDPSIRRANAGPYPGTRRLLGAHNAGQPRGEELATRLKRELGYEELGCPPPGHRGRFVMEVFPAAAMVRLFDLRAPLPYKKKHGRSWRDCQAGLADYINRLRMVESPRLEVPDELTVNGRTGKAFKDLEDRVDALLCAYVAALSWLGRAESVGTLAEGYIVLPQGSKAAAD